jgi:hypothetical protein
VHGTRVYSAGVGPNGPALERFSDIKKKIIKYTILVLSFIFHFTFHLMFIKFYTIA